MIRIDSNIDIGIVLIHSKLSPIQNFRYESEELKREMKEMCKVNDIPSGLMNLDSPRDEPWFPREQEFIDMDTRL